MSNTDDENEKPRKCMRCNYDEGEPDEWIPPRFRLWMDLVCHACAVKLRMLDAQHEDREAAGHDFT